MTKERERESERVKDRMPLDLSLPLNRPPVHHQWLFNKPSEQAKGQVLLVWVLREDPQMNSSPPGPLIWLQHVTTDDPSQAKAICGFQPSRLWWNRETGGLDTELMASNSTFCDGGSCHMVLGAIMRPRPTCFDARLLAQIGALILPSPLWPS